VQESRRLHDPVTRLKKMLLDASVAEPGQVKVRGRFGTLSRGQSSNVFEQELDKLASQLVNEAAREAEGDAEPSLAILATDVYVPGKS
jgi:TPP-dependent pyruvate/acetoin dehydrogenase alpha subunit